MQQDKRLSEISERLDSMTIHEVRQLARALNVHFDGSRKTEIIEAVLSYAQGLTEPKPKTKGAPPKSDKHDERLAADIAAYRENRIACSFGDNGKNGMSVEDGGYEAVSDLQKQAVGLIDYTDGGYCLRTDKETANVAQSFLTRYRLKAGDAVCGKILWRREQNAWELLIIESVNGNPPESLYSRKDFSFLTRRYPSKRIRLAINNTATCKLIDTFAPIALGQRAVISSPFKGGKTSVLKDAVAALGCYPNAETVLLLLSGKPEEISDFKRVFTNIKIFSTSFDMPYERHLQTANLAFEYAKRRVESGKHIVLLADGLHTAGAEEVKKLTGNACRAEEGGSLTVIYTLPQSLPYHDEILDTANAVIALSQELAASRIYPAIDAKACFSSIEQELTEREQKAANALRKNYSAEEIVNLFKTQEYSEIINKNG